MNILRKHLAALALGLCVLEIIGALLVVRPQAALADTTSAPTSTTTQNNGCPAGNVDNGTYGQGCHPVDVNNKSDVSLALEQNVNYGDVQKAVQSASGCGPLHPFACLTDVVLWIPGYVASYLVMPLMSLLVYMSGILLNWSMEYSVVHMTMHYNETGVDYIWSVIRDLANMGFIFMLLYTAIGAMFNRANVRRTIINLVIAAILINFSLLITKAVVDMSNVLAMLFYNAIVPQGTTTTTGLGAAFMQVLNLQSLYNLSSAAEGTKMAIVGVAGSAIYLIASFTFLAVAVMFIIRFVALVFVIALSPIYAIGKVLPNASGYAKEWEKALINQSFFAPVYFALTWVALKVAEGLLAGYTTANGTLNYSAAILGQTSGNTVKANPGAVGVFMMFAIIIGLLIAALTIAKGMATKAHPMLAAAINKGIGGTSELVYGKGIGGLARWQIGSRAAKIAEDPNLVAAGKQRGVAGAMSRLQLYGAKKAASASFDARRASLPTQSLVEAGGIALGGVIDESRRAQGLDFDVNKYEAALHRNVEDKLGKTNIDLAKLGVGASGVGTGPGKGYKENTEEDEKRDRAFIEARNQERKLAEAKIDITTGAPVADEVKRKEDEAKKNNTTYTRTQEETDKINAMERAIGKMSDKQVEAIVDSNRELLASQAFANRISVQQLEALNKSDKLSDTEKGQLRSTRFKSITDAVAPGGKGASEVGKQIKALTDKELEMIDPDMLEDEGFVTELKGSQVEAIQKSMKFTGTQKKTIGDFRKKPLLVAFNTKQPGYDSDPDKEQKNVDKAINLIRKMSGKDLAGLMNEKINFVDTNNGDTPVSDTSLLLHPKILPILKPNMLKKMANEMNDQDIQTLRTALEKYGNKKTRDWLDKDDSLIFS